MTKVSFYILSEETLDARVHFAIKFVRQSWRKGLSVHCHVSSRDQATELDQLLWADQMSFIPHEIQTASNTVPKAVVGIGWADPLQRSGVLVNLSRTLPCWFAHFDHLVEIVVQEASILGSTRETWKNLKFNGYPVSQHDLRT